MDASRSAPRGLDRSNANGDSGIRRPQFPLTNPSATGGGGGGGGVARNHGTSWSVMPDCLTFDIDGSATYGENVSSSSSKVLKIVNMGRDPLK